MTRWTTVRNWAFGLLAVGMIGAAGQPASAVEDNLVFRIQAEIQNGPVFKLSVPLACLDNLLSSVSTALKDAGEDVPFQAEDLFDQIAQSKGLDILRISGQEQNVRVWVEEAGGETESDLNFLKIYAKPEPNKDMEVNFCLPKGLIEMAGPMAMSIHQPVDLKQIFHEIQKGHAGTDPDAAVPKEGETKDSNE